jgi:glycerol-3-phosphate dehydrogenase (NAD(P)+)
VRTSRSVYELARQLQVEVPICEQIYLALHEGLPVKDAIHNLLSRAPKPEMQLYR